MFRRFTGSLWRPKNPHTLEYLKYLHGVLVKNEKFNDSNKNLLVDALQAITEILLWGDQNDSTVFDFFLEKQMLVHFLAILRQNCGNKVCVQLLQTLNMLFLNIKNETLLYYLLSNNHVNSIIVHNFDFDDEEIAGYYVSFLRTLSLRLNTHTVHFFFNEAEEEFVLYTEATKLCQHPEGMVRTAAKTITLHIYQIKDQAMLKFVVKQSFDYFSKICDIIAEKAIDMDVFIRSAENEESNRTRLLDMMHLYMDYCHYLNDIFDLKIPEITKFLSEIIFSRLISPLFLASLAGLRESPTSILLTKVSSLYFLAQFVRIVTEKNFIQSLLSLLFFGDQNDLRTQWTKNGEGVRSLAARHQSQTTQSRLFFYSHLKSLESVKDDHSTFYAIFLLLAICQNKGVQSDILEAAQIPCEKTNDKCDGQLFECLTKIISNSASFSSPIRSVTLELTLLLIRHLILFMEQDNYMAASIITVVESASEKIVDQLKTVLFTEDAFLNFFESEYYVFEKSQLKMNDICNDPSLLLPPSTSMDSGVALAKRMPIAAEEKVRRNLFNWFQLRKLLHDLKGESEKDLPIKNKIQPMVEVGDRIQINSVDLLSCTVITNKGSPPEHLFLVTDKFQLIFVEPDEKLALVKYVGLLKDCKVYGISNDPKSIKVVVEDPTKNVVSKPITSSPVPKRKGGAVLPSNLMLNIKVVLDDHIRCMAATQRLTKGKTQARQYLISHIADIFKVQKPSASVQNSPYMVTSDILLGRSESRPTANKIKFPGGLIRTNTSLTSNDSASNSLNNKSEHKNHNGGLSKPGIHDI
uniref:FPL domain-containing protein n=1 Tax=Rhabditophanes sp. KR3021 TaxID=114890 RepID=A0AC35TX68_9BILA